MTAVSDNNFLSTNSVWTIHFVSINKIPDNGRVDITFPSGFTLNDGAATKCQNGIGYIPGNPTCTISGRVV